VTHRVVFSEQAWRDANEIYHWIATRADPQTAEAYIGRIIDFCDSLGDFPNRGTPRDDLAKGVRTIAFEGRAVVAYVANDNVVRILRILHHGRDIGRAFRT
jgi:toxin ParE1/3/4